MSNPSTHTRIPKALERCKSVKTFAVVGNARSIFENDLGEEVDTRDMIFRINRGRIEKKESQGSRTDYLATSIPISQTEFDTEWPKSELIWLTPKVENAPDWMLARGFERYPINLWNNLFEKLGNHRPSSGLMLIHFLCTLFESTPIHLYGFDFKESPTFYTKVENPGPHDWAQEAVLVESWSKLGRVFIHR